MVFSGTCLKLQTKGSFAMPNASWSAAPQVFAICCGLGFSMTLAGGTLGCRKEGALEAENQADAVLPGDAQVQALVDEALDFTRHQRMLRTDRHAAWQIMHGVLAFGGDFQVLHEGQPVKVLDWVLAGGQMAGWTLRKGTVGVKAVVEPGSKTGQGHEDQWLGYMSQSGLALDHPLRVGSDEYTLRDLVKQAKHDVYVGKECSWTLIGLATYLPIDEQWDAADGSRWSLERIVAMEAADQLPPDQAQAEIMASACGGSHRLIGLTIALNQHRRWLAQNGKDLQDLAGGWLAAADRIRWAVDTARGSQHASGAFSVDYFQRSSYPPDLSARLSSTGHTLEFLALALDDEQLKEPWVTRAAVHLCQLFQQTRNLDLECGALYHAAHGLVLYRERRFGKTAPGV